MKRQKMNNRGQGLTEYLMLVMLIAVVSIGVVKTIGSQIHNKLETVKRNIQREIVIGDGG